MQRERDRERERERERDRERFPPPPESSLRRSSSFLHGLPPPISVTPRGYFPPSPSVRDVPSPGGLTDPSTWSSHHSPSHAQSDPVRRWSPPLRGASPRFAERLPPLASDYSGHFARHSWEQSRPLPYVKSEPRPPSRAGGEHAPPHDAGSQQHHTPEAPIISVSTPQPPPAPGSSHSSTGKHAVPAGGDSSEPPKKKKRRQAFSCAECAKRKQKCNRETPCQHCVSRKVPHLCVPSARLGSPPARPKPKVERDATPKKEAASTASPATGGLAGRVSKLEKMLNAVLNRVDILDPTAMTEWRQSHPLAASPTLRPTPEPRPTSGSSLTSAATATGTDQGEDAWVRGLDTGTQDRNPLPQSESQAPLGLDFYGTPAERLQRVVEFSGEATLRDAFQHLPPKPTADKLVAFFFAKVNHVRYPIDERLFRQAYDAVYQSREAVSPGVLGLPLVFAVLAIATRLVPDEWAGSEEQRRVQSLTLFWQSFGCMSISTAINADNIQLVETRILLGLYLILMNERRLAEGWVQFRSGIALAQALCLHRDGSKLGLEPYLVEYRRRLWSYLCHADATYSCILGRPPTIDVRFYDTQPPSNINLEDLVGVTLPAASKPLDEPTFATYLILRKQLADIVIEIVTAFQNLHTPIAYAEVQAINDRLQQLRRDLPPHFRMANPDKSRDDELAYLAVHRYYIQTEILHYTIILHRPWFLRDVRSDKHALSRSVCFDAAITDFDIREAFHRENPDFFETLLGGSFREFNTAMIAGISLLLEPKYSLASCFWNIITNYMDHHPHDPDDELSKHEATIIYTLYRRAKARSEDTKMLETHPLTETTSLRSRPEAASTATPSDATPQTPEAEAQDLFNHFLAANSELVAWPNATSAPDEGVGLLGVSGIGKYGTAASTSAPHAQFAGDTSLAFGAVPSAHVAGLFGGTGGGSKEVNTSRYWDMFADVVVEQAGMAGVVTC